MDEELRLEALGVLSTAVGALLEDHAPEAVKTEHSTGAYATKANRMQLLADDIRLLAGAMKVFAREG